MTDLPTVDLAAIEKAVAKMIRYGGNPGEIHMHPNAIRVLREFGHEYGFTPNTITVCGVEIDVVPSPLMPNGSTCWIIEKDTADD